MESTPKPSPVHTVSNVYETTRNVLASKVNKKLDTTTVSSYSYTVNNYGQRTGVTTGGTAFSGTPSWAWGYNSKGEVVKADHSADTNFSRTYAYDGIGNRTSGGGLNPPSQTSYNANALNQYTAIGSINPSYDDDGNATAYPLPANLAANSTLVWDGENRLIEAQVTSGNTVNYVYDSQSRRIAETVGSSTTVYVYDGWNPIAEYSFSSLSAPSSTLTKSYTWGIDLSGSMQGAGGVGGLLSVTDSTGTYYPTYDGNGNVSEYLDSTGSTVAHYEYDTFGKTVVATGTKVADFSHRFSTKPLDVTTGLYYYGYRYYDPETGRWPSRDPIEERGGVNLYGFVENNGVNKWDYLWNKDKIYTQSLGRVNENYTFDIGSKKPDGLTSFTMITEKGRDGCKIFVDVYVNIKGGVTMPIGGPAQGTGTEDQKGYVKYTDAQAIAMLPIFQKVIDAAWNNRFKVCCGSLEFGTTGERTIFTETLPVTKASTDLNKYYKSDCCCEIVFRLKPSISGTELGVFEVPQTRSNQFNWNTTDTGLTPGETAAHEFGHFLGNVDEYGGAKNGKKNGTKDGYGQNPVNSAEYTNSVMEKPKDGVADERHLWRIMQHLNSSGYAKGCTLK